VFADGDVAVVDQKDAIDYLKAGAASTFAVVWGAAPPGALSAFPTYSNNCTRGCRPDPARGGTCLCEITVVEEEVVAADAGGLLPSEAALRATLTIGAADPTAAGSGYTVCTTRQCTANPNISVHTRDPTGQHPTVFGIDAVFEFRATAHVRRPSARRQVVSSLARLLNLTPLACNDVSLRFGWSVLEWVRSSKCWVNLGVGVAVRAESTGYFGFVFSVA
jgi:hypothetical protein